MKRGAKESADNRSASRKWVSIQARVGEPGSDVQHACLLTDASKTGCRMYCDRLEMLPDEVVLWPEGITKPIVASIAWRNVKVAGLAFKWNDKSEPTFL